MECEGQCPLVPSRGELVRGKLSTALLFNISLLKKEMKIRLKGWQEGFGFLGCLLDIEAPRGAAGPAGCQLTPLRELDRSLKKKK